jgi:hypothetical protein
MPPSGRSEQRCLTRKFQTRVRCDGIAALSDEFAEFMLGKLVSALRPGPFDNLDEATLNAAIAVVASINPQTELQALIAVQIAATGFAGLKFLRQSQHNMDEIYVGVYGGFANKLFRLQLDMIQALDRHRRGNKQTVEVRHVHIHSATAPIPYSSLPAGVTSSGLCPTAASFGHIRKPPGNVCLTYGVVCHFSLSPSRSPLALTIPTTPWAPEWM